MIWIGEFTRRTEAWEKEMLVFVKQCKVYMVGRMRIGMRVFSTSNSCISIARKRKNCAGGSMSTSEQTDLDSPVSKNHISGAYKQKLPVKWKQIR
jgi:hypothetical protein